METPSARSDARTRTDAEGHASCPACGTRNVIPLTANTAVKVTHDSRNIHTYSPEEG